MKSNICLSELWLCCARPWEGHEILMFGLVGLDRFLLVLSWMLTGVLNALMRGKWIYCRVWKACGVVYKNGNLCNETLKIESDVGWRWLILVVFKCFFFLFSVSIPCFSFISINSEFLSILLLRCSNYFSSFFPADWVQFQRRQIHLMDNDCADG
jgi:hypothetical protein